MSTFETSVFWLEEKKMPTMENKTFMMDGDMRRYIERITSGYDVTQTKYTCSVSNCGGKILGDACFNGTTETSYVFCSKCYQFYERKKKPDRTNNSVNEKKINKIKQNSPSFTLQISYSATFGFRQTDKLTGSSIKKMAIFIKAV